MQRAIDEIVETGRKRIGLLGFSFKAGTDDLRESPLVILAEALLGKGYQVRIYDRNVSLARLVGANRRYIEEQIPHLSALLRGSLDEVVAESDVVVVGNASRRVRRRGAALPGGPGRPRPGAPPDRIRAPRRRVPRHLLVASRRRRR